MDMRLSAEDAHLQARARAFTDQVLIPLEDECEDNDGLSIASAAAAKQAVLDHRFNGINHSVADGGQGFDLFQQMLVEEQWGRATGALWDIPWRPAIPLRRGTEAQKERYLRPALRGDRRDAYAITEEGAGSDPTMVATTARRDEGAWVIDGEKWHVTSGDVADFFVVHAHVDGDPALATVFLVDKSAPGVRLVRTPKYTHTFVFEHPIFAFEGVRLDDDAILGEVGQGFELTKDWFVEERMMIGARTVGASTRALRARARRSRQERVQFGRAIVGFQAIEFMLADMAAELMAAKSLLYRACWEAARGGADRKQTHAMASAVKLVCSETAGRIIDKAVQIFGGRGYMREEPVERLYREIRVDRIWEGTSEIQRMVIGNELRKRGAELYAGWPGIEARTPRGA